PGAWHADQKYRDRLIDRCSIVSLLEEVAGEQPADLVDLGAEVLGLVIDAFGAKPVTGLEVMKCTCVFRPIMPRSSQGKMERDDVPRINRKLERRLHCPDVLIGEDLRLDVRKRPPDVAMLRIDRDCTAISGDRFFVAACPAKAVT